jgi:hypothetical protein
MHVNHFARRSNACTKHSGCHTSRTTPLAELFLRVAQINLGKLTHIDPVIHRPICIYVHLIFLYFIASYCFLTLLPFVFVITKLPYSLLLSPIFAIFAFLLF